MFNSLGDDNAGSTTIPRLFLQNTAEVNIFLFLIGLTKWFDLPLFMQNYIGCLVNTGSDH